MARAKSSKKSVLENAPAEDVSDLGTFKLDLSSVPKAPVEGDHKLGDGKEAQTLTTPRAANDVAITVRGEPKHRQRTLFKVGPDKLGSTRFKFAWRPGGQMIATASTKNNALVLHLFRRDGSVYNQHVLGPGKCTWLEWDCKGQSLGLLQEGAGIFLWDLPPTGSEEFTVPMSLCPSITQDASFCRWSKVASLLAIGTQKGKVRDTLHPLNRAPHLASRSRAIFSLSQIPCVHHACIMRA